MHKIKESFKNGIYDQWILKAMHAIKTIFWLSLGMSILSLLFVIFSKPGYYGMFESTVTILDALPYIVIYGTFYTIIFLVFPATVILLLIYILYRFIGRDNIKIKSHLYLIIWNVVILLLIFLISYLKIVSS